MLEFAVGVMPYIFRIDLDAGVIRETWTGSFGFADLIDSCYAEWKHPDFRRGLNLLSDFRKAKGLLSVDEVLKFASWFSSEEAPPRLAIVVRRERAFDFAAMFSMIRESAGSSDSRTRLFFSYAEADAWITSSWVTPHAQCPETRTGARVAASKG